MKKIVFEGKCEFDSEDGGHALIANISDRVDDPHISDEEGLFVRIQSGGEGAHLTTPGHHAAEELRGKKIRVTIEGVE